MASRQPTRGQRCDPKKQGNFVVLQTSELVRPVARADDRRPAPEWMLSDSGSKCRGSDFTDPLRKLNARAAASVPEVRNQRTGGRRLL
jgi:hypothetical protein